MNRAQTLESERRWALPAALGAFASTALFIAAVVVKGDALTAASTNIQLLREFPDVRTELLLAAILRALALVGFAVALAHLFRAASRRSPAVRNGFIGIVVAGPLFVAILDVLQWFVLDPAAQDFATPGGGAGVPVGQYAEDLIQDQALLGIYQGIGLAGIIGFTFAVVYTGLWAMRTGLLTRFMGTLGMALGVIQILIPFAQLALVFWMTWVGLIFIDRLPRGRPRAWDAGEAIPWPKPGEPAPEPPEDQDFVEGEATELTGNGTNPNAARRERARKRKRKRRS